MIPTQDWYVCLVNVFRFECLMRLYLDFYIE